jgi:hypothetical protein
MVAGLHYQGVVRIMQGHADKWQAWQRHQWCQEAREARLLIRAIVREKLIAVLKERRVVENVLQYLDG